MDEVTKKYRAFIFGAITFAAFSTSNRLGFVSLLGAISMFITFYFCIPEEKAKEIIGKLINLPVPKWLSFNSWFLTGLLAIFFLAIVYFASYYAMDYYRLEFYPDEFVAIIAALLSPIWLYWAAVGLIRYFIPKET